MQSDGVRVEDDSKAAQIERWLEQDYESLGYEVIRVPVVSVAERVKFILKVVSAAGLISKLE